MELCRFRFYHFLLMAVTFALGFICSKAFGMEARGRHKEDSRKLVVCREVSHEIWGEAEFQVGLDSKGYYLRRTMGDGFGGLFQALKLEWRKVGGSPRVK